MSSELLSRERYDRIATAFGDRVACVEDWDAATPCDPAWQPVSTA